MHRKFVPAKEQINELIVTFNEFRSTSWKDLVKVEATV